MKAYALLIGVFLATSAKAALGMESVRFASGGIELVGSFYPASAPGRRPAIVLLAGSGKAPRDNVVFHTLEGVFTAAGFSVLAYDKRGSGQSGGVWDENTPLSALAQDGIAAIGFLKARNDVDPGRIGVWGISQGGWLGPLMATMSPDVAFVISVSGPGVSIAEQAIYLRGSEMLAQGFSAQDVAEETAYRRVVWAYFGTGLGRSAAESALAIARNRPWFKKLQLSPRLSTPEALDPALREFMRQAAEYDPLAVAQAVKVSVLSIFGAKDSTAPAALGIQNLVQAYARGGNRNAAFALFANAGHGLQVVNGPTECHECDEREMQRSQHWNAAPGLFEVMTDWLRSFAQPSGTS